MSNNLHSNRLFIGSCFSLVSTSVAFAVVGAVMGALKQEFVLSNEEVGYIGGAAIWGFTLSIFVLGPLCDALGMKNLLRFSFLCHLVGPIVMMVAPDFWTLFAGALIISLGNGTVEAACNPLVATLYPDRKTEKLNQFHVWFPGGILLGGVAAFVLDQVGITEWRVKIGLIMLPTVIYGILFLGQRFPATERVQAGISFGGMLAGAFTRPLFYIILLAMAITASLELGPGRWIPAVLQAGGIHGILVLAYINGLMAVMRFFAGPVVERLSPTGILLGSALVSGIGLYWFSFSETTLMAFLSATVFAVGVCYFWPTMLGFTSEQVPRSGALGLAMVGGMGMLVVGVVTAPQMGRIADQYLHERLDPQETIAVLEDVVETYPQYADETNVVFREEIESAVAAASDVIAKYEQNGELPEVDTANALRSAIENAPMEAEEIKGRIAGIVNPADNYGGRMSFRYVAPLAAIIIIIFGILHFVTKPKREELKAADDSSEEPTTIA